MASIKREANGKWRVSVKVGKNRPSKVFDRKVDALSWASAIEFKLRNNLSDNLNISNLKDSSDINALKSDNDNLSGFPKIIFSILRKIFPLNKQQEKLTIRFCPMSSIKSFLDNFILLIFSYFFKVVCFFVFSYNIFNFEKHIEQSLFFSINSTILFNLLVSVQ